MVLEWVSVVDDGGGPCYQCRGRPEILCVTEETLQKDYRRPTSPDQDRTAVGLV